MAGVDANTGRVIDGLPHIQQSLGKLITTFLGERTMREWVGNPGTRLLGENAVPRVILQWATIVWALVDLFEPRFRIRRFETVGLSRDGEYDLIIVGEVRPYAHLDWQQARFYVAVQDGVVVLSPAA